MKLKLSSSLYVFIFIFFINISWANPQTDSVVQDKVEVSQVLKNSKDDIRKRMGINPRIPDAPQSLVTLPIYPNSEMVVHRYKGINYDDEVQTLPFATFLTEDSYENVSEFYRNKLQGYSVIPSKNELVLTEITLKNTKYPNGYYRIPNVDIYPYKLSNSKMGTMVAIMYRSGDKK